MRSVVKFEVQTFLLVTRKCVRLRTNFSALFQIFFHYSEFQGDITDVLLGDDVQFVVQDRNVCSNLIA